MPLNIKDLKIESPDFGRLGKMKDEFAGDKGNVTPASEDQRRAEGGRRTCSDLPRPGRAAGARLHALDRVRHPAEHDRLDRCRKKFRVGPNGMGQNGYFGPQPPAGHGLHHYYFWVYALNTKVEVRPSREEFLERYKDNIIEQNRVVGIYEN